MEDLKVGKPLLMLVLLLIVMSAIYGVILVGGDMDTVLAEEFEQTYELKVLMSDGSYYWVAKDKCGANEGCNAGETCVILSPTAVKLTVNAPFNYEDFIAEFMNGVGNVEGKHFTDFTFVENGQQCVFASNVVLYIGEPQIYEIQANYENERYRIIFDGNDGNLSFAAGTYEYGANVSFPEGTKTGYSLAGWQYEDGTRFSAATIPDMTPKRDTSDESIVLTALWEANRYQISFYDGNTLLATKEVAYDAVIGDLPTVTDNGYAFISFRPDHGSKDYTGITIWDIDGNVALYVYRSEIPTTYTIHYSGNGGTITNATATYNVTQLPLTLNYNAYREFDKFDRFTLNNVSITDINGKSILKEETVGNITLTAQWKAVRSKTSSGIFVTNETFSQEYIILDCTGINTRHQAVYH